ncbi:class I SAM-dependent methyltransferase [Candidatus Babeliales bacterium]|nr:class I SAM-dependent methyltransferase [Candidatus Babeliales bacterium]
MKRSLVYSSLVTTSIALGIFLVHGKKIASSNHQHQQTVFDNFLRSQPNTNIAVTHPHEWPASMYKDALLYNLRHHDSHVLDKNYLVPLFLMANRDHAKARQLLQHGTTDADLAELVATNPEASDFFTALKTNNRGKRFFYDLADYIQAIDVTPSTVHQYKRKGYLSYYAEKKEDYSIKSQETWQDKQRNVYKILQETRPQTVLDLGSNAGWFSELAEHLGAKVIATDIDESCLDYLYNKSKDHRLNITQAMLPFEQCNNPEVRERFASDTVLCLALVHHLVFVAGMRLEEIFEILAKLTKKTLILEYVDLEDKSLKWGLENPEFFKDANMYKRARQMLSTYAQESYNIKNILQIAKKYFSHNIILDSNTPERKLVILHR